MKRILIIGCPGAGKTTLAFKLQEKLDVEIIHLDQAYWKANWTETPKEEWQKKVEQLIEKDQWIMDGNYGGTMDIRMERADTILFLDFSTLTCLYRVIKRTIQFKGQTRKDMGPDCPERFDFNFFHYVLMFRFLSRKSILQRLEKFKEKEIHVFNNSKSIDNYLQEI